VSIDIESELVDAYTEIPRMSDPNPLLRRMREHGPVLRVRDHWTWTDENPTEAWIVIRRDAAEAVLSKPRLFRSGPVGYDASSTDTSDFAQWQSLTLLALDGQPHARVRRVVAGAFTPQKIDGFRPRVIESLRTEIADLPNSRRMDFFHDFAEAIPTRVILDLLGVPYSERFRFQELAKLLVADYEPMTPDQRSAYGNALCQAHFPYILAEVNGERLTDMELLSLVVFLIVAGYDTTAHTFANGVYWLLQHPSQFEELRSDRNLLSSAIEEILRYDPGPPHTGPRYAAEDMEFFGKQIKAGDTVFVWLGSVNRDPATVEDPERFDIHRSSNPHMSFGAGIHRCLGMALARLEIELGLTAVLDHMPDLALDGEPAWQENFMVHGFKRFPVRF
jgi:cytochrome P450